MIEGTIISDDKSTSFLFDGPSNAQATILLAHGAGAPMDSDWMNAVSTALSNGGFRAARFEFDYMAARRITNQRKPPPRADKLMAEYRDAAENLNTSGPLIIGGKSMGGRVASMIADELRAAGEIVGLLCLGYPFHPPGKPGKLRTEHLEGLATPTLICQGERDPFGTREEVSGYMLSDKIAIEWFEDGNHDLKPRKASGRTLEDHLARVCDAVSSWSRELLL